MSVTSGTHAYVLHRDRQCVAALLDGSHRCRDKWGNEHSSGETALLTVEHVRDHAGGTRHDDPEHLIALCHHANAFEHWGSANRDLCRAYLFGVRAQAAA